MTPKQPHRHPQPTMAPRGGVRAEPVRTEAVRSGGRQLRRIAEARAGARTGLRNAIAGTGMASLMLVGASLGAPAQPRPDTTTAPGGLVVDGSAPGQGVTAAIGHSLVALDGRMVSTPVDAKQAGEMAKLALDGKIAPTRSAAATVPTGLMTAYTSAQTRLRTLRPQCNLPWWLLAGIGKIESGHAYGGAVDATGKTKGVILGPRLDGTTPGTAIIRDTDGGALDGDTQFDRAVGPMQFLPSTWRQFGEDGNGDGVADPNNVYDAAVTAGVFLCDTGGDLSNAANISAAIMRYNPSRVYVGDVLMWAATYRDTGTIGPNVIGPIINSGSTTSAAPPKATPPPKTTITSGSTSGPRPTKVTTGPTPGSTVQPGPILGSPVRTGFTAKVAAGDASFDASASRSTASALVSYEWNFGDGKELHWYSKPVAVHRYASPGSYTVSLTAYDKQGNYQTQRMVVVVDGAPVAALQADTSTGLSVAFDAKATKDLDGDLATFDWEFGDGTTARTKTATTRHGYAKDGNYTVTLVVTDAKGNSSRTTLPVTVKAIPPIPDFDAVIGEVAGQVTFDPSWSTAKLGKIVSYAWSFGDANAPAEGGDNPNTIVTTTPDKVSHTYADEQIHGVTLTVTDDLGVSATTAVIRVNPKAPRAAVTATSAGSVVTLDAAASTVIAPVTVASYAWDFGDDSTAPAPGPTPSISHTYRAPGEYVVTLTVTDSDGLVSTLRHKVTVP